MKYKIKEYPDIKEKVAKMDLEELVKYVICPHYEFMNTKSACYAEKPAEDIPVQFFHPLPLEKAKELKAIVDSNEDMDYLICGDLECGAGKFITGLTQCPSLMALGQADDEDLAYQIGAIGAEEGRMAGFNWTFAPCVDIVMNHNDPIVSTRGISDDVDCVIKIGGAYMRGMQDHGMIATLKHFPGDGLCENDQHLTTPENPLSMEAWNETYGRVYRELIEQGAKTIMPGHIALPAYDEVDENLGVYPPATLSRKLLTDLLRNELGFEGIIVSDAVNMGGFCGFMNYYEACCRFLEAGGDCLLFALNTDRFVEEMKQGLLKGWITMDTLRDRAYRMLCFAREYYETLPAACVPEKDFSEKVSEAVTKKAVNIVRDRRKLLPFPVEKDTKIMHLILQNYSPIQDIQELTKELCKLSEHVVECVDPGPDYLRKVAEENQYDLIICSMVTQPTYGINCVKLHGTTARNMMNGWTKFETPVIFVNWGHPWLEEEYKASIDTIINTYGWTKQTSKIVADLICSTNIL